ncbi:hypothetical protein [Consotaella aegiceratis]|uniref:hypothetical protein n=1 Tax=Consotaella aegiceratis TaxID=3097961 RepID=UPI002F402F18
MTSDRKGDGGQEPANDNCSPDRKNAGTELHLSGVDKVVLSIARLIGKQMAREDFEQAMRAANDNAPHEGGGDDG